MSKFQTVLRGVVLGVAVLSLLSRRLLEERA